jgi:GxxExxY protein
MHLEYLTQGIIGCAMRVHGTLGHGFLESVYKNALEYDLDRAGLPCKREHPVEVVYAGKVVGEFFVDLFVADAVIVEVKAVRALAAVHEMQLVNYLAATGIDVGVLLNFGSDRLQFKRKHRIYATPLGKS